MSLAADLAALVKLASQAKALSKFEMVMNDLKILDKPVYELVSMLARSYNDGKVDLRKFPTFIALYGPKVDSGAAKAYFRSEVPPRLKKLKRLAGRLPPPFRRRLPPLKKGIRELVDSQKSIAHVEETEMKALVDALPDWLAELAHMLSEAAEEAQKARPGFRK